VEDIYYHVQSVDNKKCKLTLIDTGGYDLAARIRCGDAHITSWLSADAFVLFYSVESTYRSFPQVISVSI
jgi:hypothetical protein